MGRKKGVVLSYVLMVFEILSTLLLTPFIIRVLGQSEYGVYKLAASIVAYLTLLDLGIGNSIVRFAAKFKANEDTAKMNRFLGVAQLFYGAMALLALLIGVVLIAVFPTAFSKGLTPEEISLGQTLLGITSLNAAVTLLFAAYPNLLIGYGLFGVSKGVSIIQIVLRIALTALALCLGFKSIAIVSINFIMTLLSRGIMAVYVYAKLKLRPTLRGVEKTFMYEIVGYSAWIFIQMVATQINAFAGQVLLGMLVPAASAIIAIYAIGAQVVQYFQSIGSAVTGVLMPGVVSMVEGGASPRALEDEMVKIGRLSLVILSTLFGGFLVFGKQFILLWAGTEYADGYYVTCILMLVYMFIYAQSIGTQILWAKNMHKEVAIIKFVIVALNVVLTVCLIQWNPLLGATIGTFISLALGDVLANNIIIKKKIGISLGRYYASLLKGIIPAIAVAVAASLAFRMLGLSGWLGFCINIAVYCLLAGGMLLLVGLNSYEKSLIKNMISPIIKKIKRS